MVAYAECRTTWFICKKKSVAKKELLISEHKFPTTGGRRSYVHFWSQFPTVSKSYKDNNFIGTTTGQYSRGYFHKIWAHGVNHGDSSIHLRSRPMPYFNACKKLLISWALGANKVIKLTADQTLFLRLDFYGGWFMFWVGAIRLYSVVLI